MNLLTSLTFQMEQFCKVYTLIINICFIIQTILIHTITFPLFVLKIIKKKKKKKTRKIIWLLTFNFMFNCNNYMYKNIRKVQKKMFKNLNLFFLFFFIETVVHFKWLKIKVTFFFESLHHMTAKYLEWWTPFPVLVVKKSNATSNNETFF
jgi:cytochrome bd-type quinol oxidase subunit 2